MSLDRHIVVAPRQSRGTTLSADLAKATEKPRALSPEQKGRLRAIALTGSDDDARRAQDALDAAKAPKKSRQRRDEDDDVDIDAMLYD